MGVAQVSGLKPSSFGTIISENSFALKALSCIPIVGMIMQVFERSLASQISQSSDVNRKVELLKVRTQYNVCGIVRALITIAAAVALLAFNIWGIVPLAIVGAFALTDLILNSYGVHKNSKEIGKLQKERVAESSVINPPQLTVGVIASAPQPQVPSGISLSAPGKTPPRNSPPTRLSQPAPTPPLSKSQKPIVYSPMPTMGSPKQSHEYKLSIPFEKQTSISLDDIDIYTQETLFTLAEKTCLQGMSYYVAVTKDKSGTISVFDGSSLLRDYFEFDKVENPQNRQEYSQIQFYCIKSLRDKVAELFCTRDDLLQPTSGKLLKKFIGATAINGSKEKLGHDQAGVGLAYEMGDKTGNIKKDDKEAIAWYKRAAANDNFFAYWRLAEYASNDLKARLEYLTQALQHCQRQYDASRQKYELSVQRRNAEPPSSSYLPKLEKSVKYFEGTYLYNKLHLGLIYSGLGRTTAKMKNTKDKVIPFYCQAGLYLPEDDFKNVMKSLPVSWHDEINHFVSRGGKI